MQRAGVLVLVVLVLAAAQIPGRAQSVRVTITLPPVQALEGTTTHTLTADMPPMPGKLTVMSNVPWVLQVEVLSSPALEVLWQQANLAGWQALPRQGTVLSGPQGVHTVEYLVDIPSQAGASNSAPALVRFSLAPAH